MNINEQFPSKYLKAADLQGRNVTVKMGRVKQEDINGDKKLILYFQGKVRGVVLNKTNANNIASLYGGETEDWYGKEITLVEAMVDYQGKSVPAIRMRAPPRRETPHQANGHNNERRSRDDFPGDRDYSDPISSGRAPARDRELDDEVPDFR